MSKQEFVEVKVRVPRSVVDFVRDQLLKGRDEGEYWTDNLLRAVGADADDEGYLHEHKEVLERYGLSREVFVR